MRIPKIIERAHTFLEVITSVVLALIMVLIVLDAALRYLWNYPLGFVYEVTTLYLMVALFFLALSGSYTNNFHIRVHIVLDMLGPRARRLAFLLTEGLGVVLFALIAVESAKQLAHAIAQNEAVIGIISWPTWPKYALVFTGSLLLTVTLALIWSTSLFNLISGKPAPEKGQQ